MHKKVSTLKIAATYIGTVVGAGFATGQEILQFFTSFGIGGIWGIVFSTILFMLFGYIIIELGLKLNTKSHLEIIKTTSGKFIGGIMDLVITFFLFGFFTTMIAGTGALFSQQFGWSSILGCIIMAVATAITVMTGLDGVINSISIVVPFLLISVFGICIYTITKNPIDFSAMPVLSSNSLINNWFIAAFLYVSYNTIMSISVLGPIGANSKDKKAILSGTVLGGLGLGAGALLINLAMTSIGESTSFEVPMLYIASNISHIVLIAFSAVLIAEIYTTAVSSLFGFAVRVFEFSKLQDKKTLTIIGITVIAFFASLFGFSNLVKYLYPIAGYSGIILLGCFLYNWVKQKNNS